MKNIFLISLIAVFLISCSHKVKETFLIPSGFEGRINVIFNQPNSKEIKVKEGRRIYEIPFDGILLTSSKLETGILDQEYYYIDYKNNKEKINIIEIGANITDEISVCKFGVAGVYGNSNEKNSLEYIESIIASKRTIDSVYDFKTQNSFMKRVMKKTNRKF